MYMYLFKCTCTCTYNLLPVTVQVNCCYLYCTFNKHSGFVCVCDTVVRIYIYIRNKDRMGYFTALLRVLLSVKTLVIVIIIAY